MKIKRTVGYRKVGRHVMPDYCKNFSESYKTKNTKINIVFSASNFYIGYNMTIYVSQRGHKLVKHEYSEPQNFLVKNKNIYTFDEITNNLLYEKMSLFFKALIIYWGL